MTNAELGKFIHETFRLMGKLCEAYDAGRLTEGDRRVAEALAVLVGRVDGVQFSITTSVGVKASVMSTVAKSNAQRVERFADMRADDGA